MNNKLLCLNSQWQGCESEILAHGSRKLAAELFGKKPYLHMQIDKSKDEIPLNSVYAMDVIEEDLINSLDLLKKNTPEKILTAGATCGTQLAPISYLNELYDGGVAVVWFDAHGDLNTPSSSPSGHFHGMVLRTLLGDGPNELKKIIKLPLLHRQVYMAGIRDLDMCEEQYISNTDINVGRVDESLADMILEAGFKKVYIHIDVDVLNPDDFKDMLMPTKGGPNRAQLTASLSSLCKKLEIVGVGVVEYCGIVDESSLEIKNVLKDAAILDIFDI